MGKGDRLLYCSKGSLTSPCRDEDGHPEVLEGSRVRIAAQFDPEVAHADLSTEAFGPKQVRAALVHRDDVAVVQAGTDPLLLAPDGGTVRAWYSSR